ncbi:MAG TPA: ABC transporter permease [Bacillales bacterium]|nr:ABC transporter permease [Bacillales bacterium]
MKRYIVDRFMYSVVTFFVIMALTFLSMKLIPGEPFRNASKLSPEQLQIIKEHYGLDDPIPVQFLRYLWHFIHGDMGTSFQFVGQKVTEIIGNRIGPSAILGAEALVFGVIVGLILGIVAALKHNTFWDYGSMIIAVLGLSIPGFIFAGALQYIFGVQLRWLPVAYWKGFSYTILPAFSLSMVVIATIARFMRTEMLEVLKQDYILTARAKGLSNWSVIVNHSIRNALIPVITIVGPLAIALMTGILVIEKIFSIPGLGAQFVLSITTKDYPMIMGVTLFYSGLFIVTVFIVDILYGVIDPRIRLGGWDR